MINMYNNQVRGKQVHMKPYLNNKYFKWALTVTLSFCVCLLFYYLLFHGSQFVSGIKTVIDLLMPVIFGMIMAYLLTPTLNWMETRILYPIVNKIKKNDSKKTNRMVRFIGIILTALIYGLIIYLIIYMLLSQIIPSLENLVYNYEQYIDEFVIWITNVFAEYPEIEEYAINLVDKYTMELVTFVNDTILTKSSELIKTISQGVFNILGVLWDFVIGFIISIYLLASKEKFANQAKKVIYAIWKRDRANILLNNLRFAHNTFIGFVVGKVVDSIIIGFLCFAGTSILQTPYAALISVVIGVTNVIPFFGPFLGAIPCAILVLVVDIAHPLNVVYFALFILALQQLDGNVIGPKILGESTGLSSFWVIFAITIFGGIFGIPGMIFGVPVFAIIYAAVKSHVNEALINKELNHKTDAYMNMEYIDEEGQVYTYDFINNSKDKEFHSGSKYISSVDEWNYRFSKRLAEKEAKRNTEMSGDVAEKTESGSSTEENSDEVK